MSTFGTSHGLKFVWKIENFSSLKGEEFFSPPIDPSQKLVISITRRSSNIFACLHNGRPNKKYTLCFSFSLLNYDGTPLICREGELGSNTQFDRIHDKFIFPNEANFFPNDTLRVEFRMWLLGCNEMCSTALSRFACTQMVPTTRVIKKRFCCKISPVKESMISVFNFNETISNGDDLNIKINLPHTGQIFVEFSSMVFGFQAMIRSYVLDASGTEIEFGKHEATVTNKDISFTFNLDISKPILLCYPDKFLQSENLSLIFICKFSGNFHSNRFVDQSEMFETCPPNIAAVGENSETDSDEEVTDTDSDEVVTQPEPRQLNQIPTADNQLIPEAEVTEISSEEPETCTKVETISKTLQDMLLEGYLSDFTLKVGDRVFPVHKSILGMRSKEFRSWFTADQEMMEIDLDIDGDTLERLLQFVYADVLDKNMNWKDACSLYAAAHLYALEPLKQGCSEILKNGLSCESTLRVLCLAEGHQDQQLKSAALDFLSLNDQDIIGTEEWTKFEEENTKLALETFRELHKKMKR